MLSLKKPYLIKRKCEDGEVVFYNENWEWVEWPEYASFFVTKEEAEELLKVWNDEVKAELKVKHWAKCFKHLQYKRHAFKMLADELGYK